MGDVGDYWREHRDYQKKAARYHEIPCVHCGRKQNWEAPRCIRCGRKDWYSKTLGELDETLGDWIA